MPCTGATEEVTQDTPEEAAPEHALSSTQGTLPSLVTGLGMNVILDQSLVSDFL